MWWTVAKVAAANWSSHKDARRGAALAYYSVFSLGPIIVIAILGSSTTAGPSIRTRASFSRCRPKAPAWPDGEVPRPPSGIPRIAHGPWREHRCALRSVLSAHPAYPTWKRTVASTVDKMFFVRCSASRARWTICSSFRLRSVISWKQLTAPTTFPPPSLPRCRQGRCLANRQAARYAPLVGARKSRCAAHLPWGIDFKDSSKFESLKLNP